MRVVRILAWPVAGKRRRLACAAALLPVAALAAYVQFAPLPATSAPLPGTVLLARDGAVIERNGTRGLSIPVPLGHLAPQLVEATIAAEDQRFRSHPGVDPIAAARAAVRLPFGGRSGASTITQQLARGRYLADSGEPRLLRKAHEALLALQIERRSSKDEILEAYFGTVYYGRGAYGPEAAARVYFGVSAANLDLAQAAFLAGLPQSPAAYGASPEAARVRQRYVLDRMAATGRITGAEADAAAAEPLELLPPLTPPLAPGFAEYVREELARLRPDLAGSPGLVIETSLDAGIQQEAERVAALRVEALQDRDVSNAAVVVIEPATGKLLAMVGSLDRDAPDGQVNMAVQPRQPGSALKPFLYAAAFERGATPATQLLDVATTFETPSGPYSPLNYDRNFRGPVSLRVALASSLNVPAVRALDELGLDPFLEIAHRFGLGTLSDTETYGLALTLGGGEVRLTDLTAAYAALANQGMLVHPFSIVRVRDTTGKVLYEHSPAPATRVLAPAYAYQLADILSDHVARIPGFGEVSPLDLPFPAAVKTGTTTGFRDNWTIGFTPGVAIGVWVGNTDGRPMRDVSGVDGAGPIWHDLMMTAAAGRGWMTAPPGLATVAVCAPTGLLPGPDCPSRTDELFVQGTEPTAQERYFTRTPDGQLAIDPPAEARAWAISAGAPLAAAGAFDSGVQIVQPTAGAVLFLSPELPGQEVLLRATAPGGAHSLQILVDGVVAATTAEGEARLSWPLTPGQHRIEAIARFGDGRVESTASTYEVRRR